MTSNYANQAHTFCFSMCKNDALSSINGFTIKWYLNLQFREKRHLRSSAFRVENCCSFSDIEVHWNAHPLLFTSRSLFASSPPGDGCLAVRWKEDPGHVGIFPFKFLKAHCYSKESLEEKRKSIRMSFSEDVSKHLIYVLKAYISI